jgi:ATP-binding cassette subfamily B protein
MPTFQHYIQLDQMDCGPTCLRMIAKHYGRQYSLQTLREKSQIGKEGVSLLGISEAAEAIGFRTLGARISIEKLAREAALPCIVHWQQNHFVVVYDIRLKESQSWMSRLKGGFRSGKLNHEVVNGTAYSNEAGGSFGFVSEEEIILPPKKGSVSAKKHIEGTVQVADPGKGLVTYTLEEFSANWISPGQETKEEGVILLLEPTPAFYESEDEKINTYGFSRIYAYLWQYKKLIVQLALGLLVGSGLQLLFPFLTQSIVDIGINTQNISFIYMVLAAQLMLMAGRLSVGFIRSWILLHISIRVNLNILSDFLIKLMRLPLSFFDVKLMGDLMQRIGDHQRVESFLTGQTISILFSMVNLVIFGVVLAYYNLTIFAVFLFGSILYAGWVVLFLKQRRKLDHKRFNVSSKSQSALLQLLNGMQEIKLAGADRFMRWSWERIQARLFKLQMQGLSLTQNQQIGAFTINEGKNIFITFISAQAVMTGQLTLGSMLAIQYIIGQLNSPIEQMISFLQEMQDAKISLERMNEIHTLQDEEPDTVPLLDQLPKSASLQLENVSYTYPGAGNEPVLENFSLTIPVGRTTAIVGMSGSGKTTLLKLLLKFYAPARGEIRLGEVAFGNVRPSLWRSQCGVVMQEGFIFSDTIARNIAVGAERIDASRLEHAARVANLREFIDALPYGYHTKIGTEGNGISQGQKQRILIARAVYKDPQYIFFDEATNALDANNEAEILEHLDEFFKGRTVIVVAHRLSTVRNADQIVVLNKGKITEVGTHKSLVEAQGDYWKLVKNQLELGT